MFVLLLIEFYFLYPTIITVHIIIKNQKKIVYIK